MAERVSMKNGRASQPFAVGIRGYDRAQVDAFVDESSRWANQAWERIAELETRVAELEGAEEASYRAQDEVDHVVDDEVDHIVDAARAKVDQFMDEVEAKAAELEQLMIAGHQQGLGDLRRQFEEFEDQRDAVLGELAGLRGSLSYVGGRPRAVDRARNRDPRRSGPIGELVWPARSRVADGPGDQ